MYEQAYIHGFMTKCAEAGLSEDQVSAILSQLGTQFGANPIEDSPKTDYKSGVGDFLRGIWQSPEVQARKQRRFEDEYKKKSGLGKLWTEFKHPVRSSRLRGTSGALGATLGASALATALLSLAKNSKIQRSIQNAGAGDAGAGAAGLAGAGE